MIQTNTPSNQTVGQSLTIECTITSVRGINSRVDIVWSSNGSELATLEGLNYTSTTNDSVIYSGVYTIPQLSTLDEGRTLICDVIIDTISQVTATDSVTLNVNGKSVCITFAKKIMHHLNSSFYRNCIITIWSHKRSYGR